MSLVKDLTPINLQQEKEKFFADFSYNPHFEYQKLIIRNQLTKYSLPKPKYLKLAQKILDRTFHNRTEKYIRNLEGPKITLKEAKKTTQQYLAENKLTDIIEAAWSQKFLSRAGFYKNQLKFHIPLNYRRQEFLATLDHEVGTHALRRINYVKQPFFNKKKKYGFSEYMFTEEGLASLHSLMKKNFKFDYVGALNYLGVKIAQKSSFAQTFTFFNKYLQDKSRCWKLTVKHKKGLYDTSKPGGFTKDLVYFEGLIQIGNYLKNNNYDPSNLYIGKIAWQDEKRLMK